jgi:hypothetical protein
MRPLGRLLFLAALLTAVPWLALADSGADDLEQNRRQLEKWRRDPEHYARLKQDLRSFLALSLERQQQIRRLDHDLHSEDTASIARLQRVLERYVDWLDSLSVADRKKIESAATAEERLKQIRALRERQWIERLPQATRAELQHLQSNPPRYEARLSELRKQERERRAEWREAIQHWDQLTQKRPQLNRLQDLRPEIEAYLKESLLPMLGPAEREHLKQAREAAQTQGRWGLFLTAVLELAEKHPVRLPPSPRQGTTRFAQLPRGLQMRLEKAPNWPPPPVQQAEGRWPDYSLAVVQFIRANKLGMPQQQLGPCLLAEFTKAVQQFHAEKLLPTLDEEEKQRLTKAEGHWPGYPLLFMALSNKHKLPVPGTALPGGRELWAPFRTQSRAADEVLPRVADSTLREFVENEMTLQERNQLPSLSLQDPATHDQVNQMYLKRYPQELQRLRQADLKKQLRKGKK